MNHKDELIAIKAKKAKASKTLATLEEKEQSIITDKFVQTFIELDMDIYELDHFDDICAMVRGRLEQDIEEAHAALLEEEENEAY